MINKYQAGSGQVNTLRVTPSDPVSPASGGPVRFGTLTGVAIDAVATDGTVVIDIGTGIFGVSVKGVNAGGNSAVAAGDKIYYVDADTPKLSKKVAGTFFGTALEAVTSGSTATIKVLTGPVRS